MSVDPKDFLQTKYGYFDEKNREFVITDPCTPAPWVNYITNGKYNGLISHAGGGMSFLVSPKDSRITRWRYNSFPFDRPGRYVYLKDKKSGKIWSLSWQPTMHEFDKYECHHGMNYTTINMTANSVASSITYFVPKDHNMEIWKIRLKNESDKPMDLSVYSFVELCLGHALVDLINQPNDKHFNEACYDDEDSILFATKRYWVTYNGPTVKQPNQPWNKWVFNASSIPVKAYESSRDEFFGPWRSEENPIAFEKDALDKNLITAGDQVSVLQSDIQLAPGEELNFSIMLGITDKTNDNQYLLELPQEELAQEEFVKASREIVDFYRDHKNVEAALQKVKDESHNYVQNYQAQLPDPVMQMMVNVWNQYQTKVTFLFSRDASYHHGGLLFGRGYRDSCQDILGPLMANKKGWVRQRLLEMSKYQFTDGSVMHCYYPLTGGGEKTGHSDTTLWLPLAIVSYLKETADYDVLKEKVTFMDCEEPADVLTHLHKAIDFTLDNLTDRDLPLFGPGDWNDTLDYLGREGKGESVWVAMYLCYVLKLTVELYQKIDDKEKADYYQNWYDRVKKSLNDNCWDGKWYIRGTNDKGEKIGSKDNEEGKIFLNTQTWAVISGVAEGDRAVTCMNSAREFLDTPKGPKILDPAYTVADKNVGLATRCVPGKKENAAIFNHPVSWAILAECVLKRADNAYDYYQKSLPMNPVVSPDRYEVEPYVYSEYVTSTDHNTFGQASHSWLTGSSTWMLRDVTDYILGIQPDYEGLIIDPCVPGDWKTYEVKRVFRGVTFLFEFVNESGEGTNVKSMTLDGVAVEGNTITMDIVKNDTCKVKVTL